MLAVGPLALVLGALGLLIAAGIAVVLLRRETPLRRWAAARTRPLAVALVAVALVALVGLGLAASRSNANAGDERRLAADLGTPSNLLANSLFGSDAISPTLPASWALSGTATLRTPVLVLGAGSSMSSGAIEVRAGSTYRFGVRARPASGSTAAVVGRVRLLWLNRALSTISWNDTAVTPAAGQGPGSDAFVGAVTAPSGAARLRLEIANSGTTALEVESPVVTQDGVHVEQLPNGAQGALAFSFDWETAMGGAIHSKGMKSHDPVAAAHHGLLMREGADWLNALFQKHGVKATFYGTGYNFLDGNAGKETFSGDPVYKWARQRNGWDTDYWTTHKWFGDDPFGTVKTQPAWYFGDQARRLLAAGDELAPHTFGHLYVRGSNPAELATDMRQWLDVARPLGVVSPTTFAFPWRSSNSLTSDFYQVFYDLGMRTVTRVYAPDLKDQYTLGAATVYSDIAVMPDFLLGSPSVNAGEEAAGAAIGTRGGLRVIEELLSRRGTTSFWNHPEMLGDDTALAEVRITWQDVVAAAASERDKGRLWIDTVAGISDYERQVASVDARLERGFLGMGGWKVVVTNDSGHDLKGVTLTLPGSIARADSAGATILTVEHPGPNETLVSEPGHEEYPARQIVLPNLKPGSVTISLDWAPGQEPLHW